MTNREFMEANGYLGVANGLGNCVIRVEKFDDRIATRRLMAHICFLSICVHYLVIGYEVIIYAKLALPT